MATPYKMKGSPMQRNFGVGSPLKNEPGPPDHKHPHDELKVTYNEDRSEMTRTKGKESMTFKKNPEYNPKDGSPSNQAIPKWIKK